MKNFLGLFSLVVLIVFPVISFAVSFDFWETGMSINEVIRVAQENDIPIARGDKWGGDKWGQIFILD